MSEQLLREFHDFRERAEASVPMADYTALESRGVRMRRIRYAAGAVAAAVVVTIGAGIVTSLGDDTDAIEPAEPEAPVEIARAFVAAAHDSDIDIDEATRRFAVDATVGGGVTADQLEYLRMMQDAKGFEALGTECEDRSYDQEDSFIDCTTTFHALGSEELGLGPYEFTQLAVVSDGKVTTLEGEGGGPNSDPDYAEQLARPWGEWVESTVDPELLERMEETERGVFDPSYSGEPVTRAEVEEYADQLRALKEEYLELVKERCPPGDAVADCTQLEPRG